MPIRCPTPRDQQYDFWQRSVAGERVPRTEDDPQPGFYKTRMVRNGPFVPVEIWLEQEIDPETGELTADERLRAICNGNARKRNGKENRHSCAGEVSASVHRVPRCGRSRWRPGKLR
ncbi:hypothetical protein [Paracoccus alkanivorans]|uniref:hypothetical protein n=1 Tax=Paracoccus alkanivorans TaxID=2116655 RepID=UPI0014073506|nr:hypothetical protein [Paracoccus alkanivorans]